MYCIEETPFPKQLSITNETQDATTMTLEIYTRVGDRIDVYLPKHNLVLQTDKHHEYKCVLTATEFNEQKYDKNDKKSLNGLSVRLKYLQRKQGDAIFGSHLKNMSSCIEYQLEKYSIIFAQFGLSLNQLRQPEQVFNAQGELVSRVSIPKALERDKRENLMDSSQSV